MAVAFLTLKSQQLSTRKSLRRILSKAVNNYQELRNEHSLDSTTIEQSVTFPHDDCAQSIGRSTSRISYSMSITYICPS